MSVKRRRKGTDGLIERIGDLERRIRELEARPPQIVTAPVYVQPPVYVPAPYVPPNYPWITCGSDGLFAGNASAPTFPDFSDTPLFTTGQLSVLS